jgi:hypothetical protein
VALQNGAIVAKSRGGRIGRMPIHPALMQYGHVLFQDLWTALDRERKSILKLGAIELHAKTVVLTPRQA